MTQISNRDIIGRPSYTYEELLVCAEGELFDPWSARLPLPPMLMIDRITEISSEGGEHGKGIVCGELDIHKDLWFFSCHFRNDPVMPGCLGLDALWQMLGFFLAWDGGKGQGRALGVSEVKFFGQVLPSTKLVKYRLDLKRVLRRESLVLGVADGTVEADGKGIYSARDLRVGLSCRFHEGASASS